MVFAHQTEHTSQWATITSIASKIGCNPETLRSWVRQAERDEGKRPGLTTDERERIKALESEVRELRQANEILRKASAYFAAAELDRPSANNLTRETALRGWACSGESVRELSDWNYVTTSADVGASPAAETLRAQAASYRFAAPVKISADLQLRPSQQTSPAAGSSIAALRTAHYPT
jgi:transposase-like protein